MILAVDFGRDEPRDVQIAVFERAVAGKDLIDSVKLSGDICRALGGTPPEGFNYELFLDEKGEKIYLEAAEREKGIADAEKLLRDLSCPGVPAG